jgi:fumarate hydratase subunit alpha
MPVLRTLSGRCIAQTVRELFLSANTVLPSDVLTALERARERETADLGGYVLERILENARVAHEEGMPLCQDTGLAVVFLELGQAVHVTDGDLEGAVQEGVRQAYRDGCLRKSVCDPLSRVNTGDNTPAVLHIEIVPGDRLRITVLPKGGGSENMSGVAMLMPAEGEAGVRRHVVEQVRRAGPNPCPPLIVGVGLGGSLDQAPILAKKALLRPVGSPHPADPRLAEMEAALLREINALGIGPQGYGGEVTALAVHIEMRPCHIASLPVAVNLQCHAARHRTAVL